LQEPCERLVLNDVSFNELKELKLWISNVVGKKNEFRFPTNSGVKELRIKCAVAHEIDLKIDAFKRFQSISPQLRLIIDHPNRKSAKISVSLCELNQLLSF
jgi:hypothetical protein